jgi:glycosyltransferase involved in cell wall biosynthesis
MKILLLCEYYGRLGGSEHYLLSVAEELEKLGHRIAVACGVAMAGAPAGNGRSVYPLSEVMAPSGLSPEASKRVNSLLDSEDPEVIYAHNVPNSAVLEAFAARVPVVRYVHDHRLFCPAGDKVLRGKKKACDRPCGCDCLIQAYLGRCLPRNPFAAIPRIRAKLAEMAVSRGLPAAVAGGYMRECLIDNGFEAARITVLPYFCPAGEEPVEGDYLLFAGRIYWQKGLRVLLEAMHRIPGARLKVAGVGPDLESCRAYVRSAGLEPRVEFLGMLSPERMRSTYAACLALAVPSIWPEPFGIVGIEAMAAAKPVVAFDVGGVRDWLVDGENGYVVRSMDIQGLAARLEEILSCAGTRRRMGARGRDIWAARFTREKHMEGLMDLLGSAGAGNAHRC